MNVPSHLDHHNAEGLNSFSLKRQLDKFKGQVGLFTSHLKSPMAWLSFYSILN